jgi:hypothetical protein
MKNNIYYMGCLLLLSAFTMYNTNVLAQDISVLANGVTLHVKQESGEFEYAIINVARHAAIVKVAVPRAVIRADENIVSQAADRQRGGLLLSDYKRDTNAFAIISGGYVASFAPPKALGFIKVDGRELQDNRTNGGIFCSSLTDYKILSIEQFNETDKFLNCLQAGTLIVEDGKGRHSNTDTEAGNVEFSGYQSFIGTNPNGGLVLGIIHNFTLEKAIKLITAEPFECTWAMSLAGTVTTGLAAGNSIYGHNDVLLPTAIALFPPATATVPAAPTGLRLIQ